MDQFEVLVGNYGIKPRNSAPMASIKSGVKTLNTNPANSWSSTSRSKSNSDLHDDPFQFNSGTEFQKRNNGGIGDFDTGFHFPSGSNDFASRASNGGSGMEFDMESVFRDSMNLGTKPSSSNDYDDLFSGFSGKNTSAVDAHDLLSSTPKKVHSVDDLFGNLGGNGSFSRGSISRTGSENRSNSFDHEGELIPGFGSATATNNGMNQYPKATKKKPQEASFFDIESHSDNGGQCGSNEDGINDWNFQAAAPASAEVDLGSFFTTHSGKSSAEMSAGTSEVDIDDIFSAPNPNRTSRAGEKPIPVQKTEVDIDIIFSAPNTNRTTRVGEKPIPVQKTGIDIDSIFGVPNPSRTTRVGEKPRPVQKTGVDIDSIFSGPSVNFGADTRTKSKSETAPDFSSGTKSHSRNNVSSSSSAYEFDFFGGSTKSAAFEEIDGEDDDRRRARFERYQRTEARMAQALAEMNNREFEAQQERDERHRIAEIKDSEMKLWAAGKEGNLRALLSSLDQVLWPECGWKSLSLADLITSAQVKIAYKKAALYVHPDKVQQKGATAQQKYVAEKVFDLLKEAWNKFNQEELR